MPTLLARDIGTVMPPLFTPPVTGIVVTYVAWVPYVLLPHRMRTEKEFAGSKAFSC